jgi:hypothetical protein
MSQQADVLETKIRKAIRWTAVWAGEDAFPVVGEIFDEIVSVLKQTP